MDARRCRMQSRVRDTALQQSRAAIKRNSAEGGGGEAGGGREGERETEGRGEREADRGTGKYTRAALRSAAL